MRHAALSSARWAASFFFFFAIGCANKQDVVIAKLRGRGSERVYPVNVDQAWAISKTILQLAPTEKIEEHRSEGYMLTSSDPGSLSPGTYIGVFVESHGPAAAKVTFITRRRTPTQAYTGLGERDFHYKFGELLALIAAVGQSCESAEPRGGSVDAGPRAPLGDAPADEGR
jgi:hypothetical protein